MNKSIKKSIFITIILMNIFFFNTYKVNAKTEITECYYVLPNSNIYMNGTTSSIRDVYSWMENNEGDSKTKTSTSKKRMYFSIKIKYDKYFDDEISGNDWSLNKKIEGGTTAINIKDGCPKYISYNGGYTSSNIDEKSSKDDEKYINYIENYYDSKIKLRNDNTFSFDNADLPTYPKYIPLYYYKTKKGGDNKCYLDENIVEKQASYCDIQYDGINPIQKYVQLTALSYSLLSTKIRDNFKSSCNIKNLNESERNDIYKSVVDIAKNGFFGGGEACVNAKKSLGLLSAASYYYSEAITSGGSGGFKSYKKYYNQLIDNKLTYMNSSFEIDSGFLSLAKIKSSDSSGGADILDSYLSLDEQKKQANELSVVTKHICDNSSFDSTQCNNAVNACRNGDSPTSDNIRTCYINTQIAAQAQVGICDSLLAKCMEESQGITDAKDSLTKLNGERGKLNAEITKNENILKDAKKSIPYNEDESNPLLMLNKLDSSANFECSDISFLRIIWLIMIIAAPILTIVFGILDFTQAVMAGDEQKMNKLKSKFIKRLLALALFIILPIIIKTIVNISDDDSVRSIKMAKCIVNGED